MSEPFPIKTWPWFCAIYAYDFGDPAPLAELQEAEPVPPEYKKAVSDIINGKRKRNLKAAAKMKIAPEDYMRVAASLQFLVGMNDLLLEPKNVDQFSEKNLIEPTDQRRRFQQFKKIDIQDAADELGISVPTIKNMLAELRSRLKRWPDV